VSSGVICLKSATCPLTSKIKNYCRHMIPHRKLAVPDCQHKPCKFGGHCVPVNAVVVQEERELP